MHSRLRDTVLSILLILLGLPITSQNLVLLEYFIDEDPGLGMATEVPISEDTLLDVTFNIPLEGLAVGSHTLYVRVKDSLDQWSFVQKQSFLFEPAIPNPDVTMAEYFFDNDPGLGMASLLPVTPAQNITVVDDIDISNLTPGSHTLYVRVKDENDKWSFPQKQSFIFDPAKAFVNPDITRIEYYIDTDPGLGMADSIIFAHDNNITVYDTLNLNDLNSGSHTLYARALDEAGRWSFPQKQNFFFDDQRVEFVEFKFDSIPAYADWVESNPFAPDFDIEADISFLGICDLDTGWYHIDARARREISWWSEVYTDSIEIKYFYDYEGVVLDQFDDPIIGATLYFAGADTLDTDGLGEFFTLLPKCWGDTISAFKDSIYSALNSYYFENPLVDFRAKHILHDLDTVLYGYKCQNHAGMTGTGVSYICENASVNVSRTGEFIDTGSIAGYILHDGVNTLGNILDSNLTGIFTNDDSYPRNQKFYVSSVVGRPVNGFPDIHHPCTDIEFPGQKVVFLNIQDTTYLQLDSMGMSSINPPDLLIGGCPTCEIVNTGMTQAVFDCDDLGFNTELLLVDNGSGSNGSCPMYVQVNDSIVPVIMCRTDTLVHTDPAMCNFTPLNGLFQPDSTWDNCPITQINDFNSATSLDGVPFPLGMHQVKWLITDPEGNQDSCTFNVTVEDHEAPTITCPPDATVNTDTSVCTYTVSGVEYNPVNVADNCTDFTFSNSLDATTNLSGYILPLGSTPITWTVDDQHGQTASCTFTVTVEDNEVPQIQCAVNAMRNTDPGVCTYTIVGEELDLQSVSDNCTDFTFFNDKNSMGSLATVVLELGENEITWTVDDQHGNTATCALTVTVEDNESPVITCPVDTVRNTNSDQCDYAVSGSEFNPISVADNCMDFTFSNNLNSADSLNNHILTLGANVLTWTVDDQHGQTAQCSFTVTVVDNQIPIIQCPADITLVITSAHCDTTFSYNVTGTDNCPGATPSLTGGLGSGQAFPIGVSNENWSITDIGGNIAECNFNITVTQLPRNTKDTICYGDSIYLAGDWQYDPGVYIDTFTNTFGCDSVVLTDLDTTTYCIWPTNIVYVDSSASGDNTGVDWPNAYIDLQLAFDIGRRYLNVTQIWVARGTYFPTSQPDRTITFNIPDSLFILGGFGGTEPDSSARDFQINTTVLSGNIGDPFDVLDNSRHVLETQNAVSGTVVDGFIIANGLADFGNIYNKSGGGLINRGQLTLSNCRFINCSSINPGHDVINLGSSASLRLHSTELGPGTNSSLFNILNADVLISGSTLLGN